MSQAKVDRYKEEKANRKEIMKKEKRNRFIGKICGWVILLAIVSWAGVSAVNGYINSRPIETVYANLDSLNDYMSSLNAEE